LSSVKSPTRVAGRVDWSEMSMLNNKGATTAPCGNSMLIFFEREMSKPYFTEKKRLSK